MYRINIAKMLMMIFFDFVAMMYVFKSGANIEHNKTGGYPIWQPG